MATNVIKHKDNSAQDFLVEEINDLLYGIKKNTETNDVKASNLIYSYNALKIAHILTAILGIALCVSLLIATQKKEPITIKDPIKIENITPNSTQNEK